MSRRPFRSASESALVPRWTLLSALLAPLSLVLGCWLGALRQPHFDSAVGTISALAGLAAHDRWLMSAALLLLGACHITTAFGLRFAAWHGRALLAVGGLFTMLVALFPLPRVGTSVPHLLAASVTFVCLAAWPLLALRRGEDAGLLRARPALAATAVLVGLLLSLLAALQTGVLLGLAERLLALAEAVWPLCVVLSLRRTA